MVPFSAPIKPMIGGKTSLTCQSLFGSPPLTIIWYKDGVQLTDSPSKSIRIQSMEALSALIVDSITSSSSGNYTCKISNRYGSDSYTTELLIEGKIG